MTSYSGGVVSGMPTETVGLVYTVNRVGIAYTQIAQDNTIPTEKVGISNTYRLSGTFIFTPKRYVNKSGAATPIQ